MTPLLWFCAGFVLFSVVTVVAIIISTLNEDYEIKHLM